MRAFVYARYSTGPNQKDLSIEGQIRECREYADAQGIDVLGVYADKARSGRTDNRAEFRRLMRDSGKGVADVVLVWKFDRFFRNRAESALYRKQLEEKGVRLVSVREPVPEGSAGIITSGLLETLAEWYSAQLAENVTRGMYDTARKGLNTGPYPLGYRVVDKRLTIDPVGADAVQKVFAWYAAGQSPAQIAQKLNDAGYKTVRGGAFNKSSFGAMLRNKRYIGVLEYGGEVMPGGCPRIVDDDLFFAVQRKLDANRGRPGAYSAGVEYALSGKLFCGHCGALMQGMSGRSKQGVVHYYYACGAKRARKGCKKKNVRQAVIETAVLDAVLGILDKDMVAQIAAEVEQISREASGSQELLDSLHAQLAEVEKALRNIGKAIMAGMLTETTRQLLDDAEADRAALRRQIDAAQAMQRLTVRAADVAAWLDRFREGDRNDPAFRRAVFGALVGRVFVWDDHVKIVCTTGEDMEVALGLEELEGSSLASGGAPLLASSNMTTIFFVAGTFGLAVPLKR